MLCICRYVICTLCIIMCNWKLELIHHPQLTQSFRHSVFSGPARLAEGHPLRPWMSSLRRRSESQSPSTAQLDAAPPEALRLADKLLELAALRRVSRLRAELGVSQHPQMSVCRKPTSSGSKHTCPSRPRPSGSGTQAPGPMFTLGIVLWGLTGDVFVQSPQ